MLSAGGFYNTGDDKPGRALIAEGSQNGIDLRFAPVENDQMGQRFRRVGDTSDNRVGESAEFAGFVRCSESIRTPAKSPHLSTPTMPRQNSCRKYGLHQTPRPAREGCPAQITFLATLDLPRCGACRRIVEFTLGSCFPESPDGCYSLTVGRTSVILTGRPKRATTHASLFDAPRNQRRRGSLSANGTGRTNRLSAERPVRRHAAAAGQAENLAAEHVRPRCVTR